MCSWVILLVREWEINPHKKFRIHLKFELKTFFVVPVTGDNLCVTTWAIYFARWPANRTSEGQHGIVSTTLRALPFRTFHVLGVRYMMLMRIPSTTKSHREWQSVGVYLRHLGNVGLVACLPLFCPGVQPGVLGVEFSRGFMFHSLKHTNIIC